MKILVVDDEPLVRKSLSRACAARGHSVVEAADGLEGLRLWRESAPDVAFVDVLMPGLSGPDLLREIGPRGNAKAILISAYSGDHDLAAQAAATGADLFIPKPFEDIFAVVERAEALHGSDDGR